MISTLTGKELGAGDINAQYWVSHISAPVRYQSGAGVKAKGVQGGIEVGPGSTLLSLTAQTLNEEWLSLVSPAPDAGRMGSDAGQLAEGYRRGVEWDWQAFEAGYSPYRLPADLLF